MTLASHFFSISALGQASPARENIWTYTTSDGCTIYVKEIGEGQPTLVFHGGPASDHAGLVEPLLPLANKLKLVFFDQRGSLRSPCPSEATFSVDKIVSDVAQLIQIRDFRSVNIISHSFGGISAASFLRAFPDRVGKFLVITPVPLVGISDEIVDATSTQRDHLSLRSSVDFALKEEGLSRDMPTNEYDYAKWLVIHAAPGNLYDIRRWRKTSDIFLNYRQQTGLQIVNSLGSRWDFSHDLLKLGTRFSVILTNTDMLSLDFSPTMVESYPRSKGTHS